MRIQHDGRGNIVDVIDVTPKGVELTQSYEIDRHNRVTSIEFAGSTKLNVSYDNLGRPDRFSVDDSVVTVEYLSDGEPIRLRSGQESLTIESNQIKSPFLQITTSPRAFLHNDRRMQGQPDYGVVQISKNTLDIGIVPVEFKMVPGYLNAASTLLTMKSWLSEANRNKVEKPSNPIFQPPEYESTNCCVVCPWMSTCGWLCTTHFSTGPYEQQTCLCVPIYSGPTKCTPTTAWAVDVARTTTSNHLLGLPYGPKEEGVAVDCPSPDAVARTSKTAAYDICLSISISPTNTVYTGHTHPLFTKSDVGKTITCDGAPVDTLEDLDHVKATNDANEKCSKQDGITAAIKPLLLRTPKGSIKEC